MVVLGVLIRRDLPNASRGHQVSCPGAKRRPPACDPELCRIMHVYKAHSSTSRFTWRDGSHPSEEPRRRQFESVSGRFFSCEYLFF